MRELARTLGLDVGSLYRYVLSRGSLLVLSYLINKEGYANIKSIVAIGTSCINY